MPYRVLCSPCLDTAVSCWPELVEACGGSFLAQFAACPDADTSGQCPQQYWTHRDWQRETHHLARQEFGLPCNRGCPRAPSVSRPALGKSLIERVKERWRIEDLADRLTDMRWRGVQGMGRCPFHDDRGPSFSVNRERQLWHCFAACGGGDVVDLYRLARERGLSVG